MAYNPYDPNNQGIGTIDLGQYGLQQPEENMTVAEAINYGMLPQAKEKFEASYPTGFSKSSNFGGNTYTGTTKGDFFDALQKGTFGMKTEDMFNKNINDLFEGVADDEIGTGWTDDAKPTFQRTGTGFDYKGNIDIPKQDLDKELIDMLPGGFFKSIEDDQASLDLPANDKYAMAISNYDQLFGPKTMTDAFGTTHNLAALQRPDLYTGDLVAKTGQPLRNPFAPVENEFRGPHDSSVFGMNMPNTTVAEAMVEEDRIPGRIQESVPKYQNWFQRMMSNAQDKLGGAWGKTKELGSRFKEGAKPVFGIASMIGNAFHPLNPKSFNYNPDLVHQLNFMDREMPGWSTANPTSGLLQYAADTPLAGKNVMSIFGSNDPIAQLEKTLARRQKTWENYDKQWAHLKETDIDAFNKQKAKWENKFFSDQQKSWLDDAKADQKARIDKKNKALALKEKQKEDRKKANQTNQGWTSTGHYGKKQGTTGSWTPGGSYRGGGGNWGNAPGTKGGWGPGAKRDGGRVGYANGGLASLFTRRG
jgi:hypothetical protein